MAAMLVLIGLIVVAFLILHQRSTGIVSVNPLKGPAAPPSPSVSKPRPLAPDLGRALGLLQAAAKERVSAEGRGAVRALVKSDRFIEAVELYQRLYGVRLSVAKKAVEKMMLEE